MEQSSRKILIVEDDEQARDTLAAVLEEAGYTVDCAANGQEALNHLAQAPAPCLVLLDLLMPVMNGWEFVRIARDNPALAPIPIIVLSAIYNSGAPLGIAAFLTKPLLIPELLEAVARHCR
jgi:CheY-like chemotaxis protein